MRSSNLLNYFGFGILGYNRVVNMYVHRGMDLLSFLIFLTGISLYHILILDVEKI